MGIAGALAKLFSTHLPIEERIAACKTRSSNNDWRNAFGFGLPQSGTWRLLCFGAALARSGKLVSVRSGFVTICRYHFGSGRTGKAAIFIPSSREPPCHLPRTCCSPLGPGFGVVCLVMSLSAAVGIWRLAG